MQKVHATCDEDSYKNGSKIGGFSGSVNATCANKVVVRGLCRLVNGGGMGSMARRLCTVCHWDMALPVHNVYHGDAPL